MGHLVFSQYITFDCVFFWGVLFNESYRLVLQILEVVRSHYDSLTLKLHDSLDTYERYAERAPVAAFLSTILRSVVSVCRTTTDSMLTECCSNRTRRPCSLDLICRVWIHRIACFSWVFFCFFLFCFLR